MKTMKIAGAILLVLALLSLGAIAVSAAGPAGTSPAAAPFLDNQSHTIPANGDGWFKFNYNLNSDGTVPVTNIVLVNGAGSGLNFEVWTPQGVTDTVNNTPIGRGSTSINGNDLNWTGGFGSAGTYFVHVINSNASDTPAMFNISGSGFSLGQAAGAPAPAPAAPSAPAQAPAASASGTNMDDPNKAAVLDGQMHSIPAGSAVWYSFPYSLNDDGSKPDKTITLMNGTNSGVTFQVWTPDQMQGGWWNNNPVGQGTAAAVDCSTGELGGAADCSAPDLTWTGNFAANGTYWVRVINSNSAPTNATLTIQ